MYSYGPPHIAVRRQDDHHEHTFSSYVRIRDVVLKTCLGRWTIGRSGERGSGISVLPARHDDDDDDRWGEEYTDCILYRGVRPTPSHLIPKRDVQVTMVRLLRSLSSIPLLILLLYQFWSRVVEAVRFPSMGQTNLFKNH